MLNLAGHSAAVLCAEVKFGDAGELALDLGEHSGVRVAALQACAGTACLPSYVPFLARCYRSAESARHRLLVQSHPKQKYQTYVSIARLSGKVNVMPSKEKVRCMPVQCIHSSRMQDEDGAQQQQRPEEVTDEAQRHAREVAHGVRHLPGAGFPRSQVECHLTQPRQRRCVVLVLSNIKVELEHSRGSADVIALGSLRVGVCRAACRL